MEKSTLIGRRQVLTAGGALSAGALAPGIAAAASSKDTTRRAGVRNVVKGVTFARPLHVRLTPEEYLAKFPLQGGAPPSTTATASAPPPKATPAIAIRNGQYMAGSSAHPSVTAGNPEAGIARGVKIRADNAATGGVYATGAGPEYVLADADIELDGDNPSRSLVGPECGASADDYATLTIRNCRITVRGKERHATAAQNHSTLKVYNSVLRSLGNPFVADRSSTDQKVQMEVDGNSRCHAGQSYSYNYFYYSTIIAEGWGALAMDMPHGFAYLEAQCCKIQTIQAGYGNYSDPGCHNYFDRCDFDVADMAGELSGESDMTFRDTTANCGSYFLLIHNVSQPQEVSSVQVSGGRIRSRKATVRVKSANVDLLFDGVDIASESGTLIESVVAVDPHAAKAAHPQGVDVFGIHATLRNMTVRGDIVHTADRANRRMAVYLENTTLRGAIRDATISLDSGSRWVATGDSSVTLVGEIDVNQIDAPAGTTVSAVAAESGRHTLAGGGALVLTAA